MGTVGGRLDHAQTTLVLDSPMVPASAEVCLDLLGRDVSAEGNVLSVLLARPPDRHVDDWERHVGELPENFEILSAHAPTELPGDVDVETVRWPGDLTRLGVLITERLAGWTDGRTGSFCLRSETVQLQYATTEQVYRFLHTLCAHLYGRARGGTSTRTRRRTTDRPSTRSRRSSTPSSRPARTGPESGPAECAHTAAQGSRTRR